MAGKFGKFGFRKALFVSCASIVPVAEAPADHESTNEDFRGCSRDDKPVFAEERYFPPGRTDLVLFPLEHISYQESLNKMPC